MESLDIDYFIIEIEYRPVIWDVRLKSYGNKFLKAKAWEELCLKFIPNFNDMDASGKTKAGMSLYFKY